MTNADNGKQSTIPPCADRCPFWVWEYTNAHGIGEGHCTALGGKTSLDGPDPCCRAGFSAYCNADEEG